MKFYLIFLRPKSTAIPGERPKGRWVFSFPGNPFLFINCHSRKPDFPFKFYDKLQKTGN